MADPSDFQEYLDRFRTNSKLEGFGLSVSMSVPCPFCAAPAFMKYRILDTEKALQDGATCADCGRSAKAVFQKSLGVTQFEVVQTGGPDQPTWLQPKMRRVA